MGNQVILDLLLFYRRVSARKNLANSEVLDIIGRPGDTCQTEDNIDNRKLVSDGDNAADKKEFVLDAENHINDNVQSKRFIYSTRLDDLIMYSYFTTHLCFYFSFGLFLLQVLCRKAVCQF